MIRAWVIVRMNRRALASIITLVADGVTPTKEEASTVLPQEGQKRQRFLALYS